jgi:glycosyltransferase involved in cell wall biosynthesis
MRPFAAQSAGPHAATPLPRVLIVGTEDVNARIELMCRLADSYTLAAAGTVRALARQFEQCGFGYYHYPMRRALGPLSDVYAVVALWRLLSRYRPHIVHAFDTKPGVYGCLAARLAGVPVVLGTVTGLGSLYTDGGAGPRLVRGVYEGLQRLASTQADLTIFQNREDRDEFVGRRIVSAASAALIPGSGVPTDALDPAKVSEAQRRQVRAALGVPADALLVTMVSRVIRSKGVEEFVTAARAVRQELPGSHFLLVGPADGDSVDSFSPGELQEFAQVVNCAGSRKDVPHVLAASDLFVLPSYLREGIPRVLLEAGSMGLPLITTNTPGCNEVVEEGVNGRLVPARDPAALGRAILGLLRCSDQRLRFGRASRERAVQRFDLSVIASRTHTLYQQLLARKAPEVCAAIDRGLPFCPGRKR